MENNDLKFKNKYRIQSIRLSSWDYCNNGYYFVTICTKDRICNFGKIENEIMCLSQTGGMAKKYWLEILKHFPFVKLDEFVVMPNHIHGILIIEKQNNVETPQWGVSTGPGLEQKPNSHWGVSTGPGLEQKPNSHWGVSTGTKSKSNQNPKWKPNSLGSIINQYKSICTKKIRAYDQAFAWQSRFYDHVIRNEKSLNGIRKYIICNPKKWQWDKNNPII